MTFSVGMSSSKKDLSNFNSHSSNSKKTLTFRTCLFLTFVAGFFAHWPALIDDSIMWDDWIMFAWIAQEQPDWIFQFFHNYGVTPYCLVYWPFTLLTNNTAASFLISKILIFLGVILNAILIMLISNRIARKNLLFATLAGISAACFPALSGEGFRISGLFFYFFIPLFLLGVFFFITITSSKKPKLFIRITALIILLLSFSLNSLLVLFYALIPAIFYTYLPEKRHDLKNLHIYTKKFLLQYLDFLLLPLIFWLLKSTLMPRIGIYASYNTLRFDWVGIFHAYEQLIPNLLQTTLFVPLSIQFVPEIAITVFILTTLISQPILKSIENNIPTTRSNMIILLGLGLLALIGSAFPYYMIGRRSFQAFGFMSRDNVIFPLSVSWCTAALFSMLLSLKIPHRRNLNFFLKRLTLGVFSALVISQCLSNWRNHADWQSHYAYIRSVTEKIPQLNPLKESSIIQVVDNLPGDRSLPGWKYPISIWTEIISSPFLKTTRLAIPHPPKNEYFFTQSEIQQCLQATQIDFMLKDINTEGPQLRITIDPGIGAQSPLHVALAYWQTRFFAPKDMPKFLDSLTKIKVERIDIKKE